MNPSIASVPWAILRTRLQTYMDESVDLYAEADLEAIETMYAARGSRSGAVAVVPVFGPITKRDTMFTQLLGGTSTNRLSAQMRQLAVDDSISHVILNVDSPGGTISGLPELAADVRALAAVKPVTAISNDLNASAAYWISAQATTIVASPESHTGSIGVFGVHEDLSGAAEQAGVKVEVFSTSEAKAGANPFVPLTDETRENMQALVDSAGDLFVADVAKGRGVSAATVRNDFGDGLIFDAKGALKAGLIDRIGTFNDTVARVAGSRGNRAESDFDVEAETGLSVEADAEIIASGAPSEDVEAAAEKKARADRLEIDQDRWRFRK